jgi:Rieske Fe-S protein
VTHRSISPAAGALGIAVLLAGLAVDPWVLTPLGAAIVLVAGTAWLRSLRRELPAQPAAVPRASIEPEGGRYPRSRFLEGATLGVGGLVGLLTLAPAAAFFGFPAFFGQRQKSVDLGPIDAFPVGQFVVARFLSDPQAGVISRRAAYVRNNGLLGRLPSFTILSSRCTHVGCPTQPNGQVFTQRTKVEQTSTGGVSLIPASGVSGFGCPCHGSEFDTEGNRTAGPAPRALDRYEFSVRRGRLFLDRLISVSQVDGTGAEAQIHAVDPHGAGQPVTGLESWLYPISPPQ